jgi:hypothetical protein
MGDELNIRKSHAVRYTTGRGRIHVTDTGRNCRRCGAQFVVDPFDDETGERIEGIGRSAAHIAYCSNTCRTEAKREQTKARVAALRARERNGRGPAVLRAEREAKRAAWEAERRGAAGSW